MKVWCLFDYRDLEAIYTTKEAAEKALAEAIGPDPLLYPNGTRVDGYHIEEWDAET